MLGIIQYPWWLEPLLLLVLVAPIVISYLVYKHGNRLGKFRMPVVILILVLSYASMFIAS